MKLIGEGIGIGSSGTTMYFDNTLKNTKSFKTVDPKSDFTNAGFAAWGTNNLLPQEMIADIEATGALWAGIEAKARIGVGKGPMPAKVIGINEDGYELLKFIPDNTEVNRFMAINNSFKQSYSSLKDLFGSGSSFYQILLTPDRKKIAAIKRHDYSECRLSVMKNGRIEWVYISSDWSSVATIDGEGSDKVQKIPLLDRDYPLYDLQQRKTGHVFMLHIHYPLYGRKYYPPAPWYSAIQYVKIAQSIPEMKVNMFKNQATIKYVITIHPEFWTLQYPDYTKLSDKEKQQRRAETYDAIEKNLTGNENAYKSLFNPKVYSKQEGKDVPALDVQVVDDKMKDGKLLPDSAMANIEILLPLMINAALLGVDMPGGAAYGGGAGSGSNIREAYLVQVMIQETERQLNNQLYDLVKYYNGWDEDIVWRYPNQILTTLNTGKNTQATA